MNLLQKILHFVMILKVGLPSLNAFFSGPKSQNEKVSVPISKRITCRFPNSPYFYSQCHFYGSYDHLNMGPLFLGHPVETGVKCKMSITHSWPGPSPQSTNGDKRQPQVIMHDNILKKIFLYKRKETRSCKVSFNF